jgi:hypothetical protein
MDPPSPPHHLCIYGRRTFRQCLGSWCFQLLQWLCEELPTVIYVYSSFSGFIKLFVPLIFNYLQLHVAEIMLDKTTLGDRLL